MSTMHLKALDTTVQKTHQWLNEICDELGWEDRHKAYLLLRATLHALRDQLPNEEVVQFAAQLPMLIRGMFYEGWTLKQKARKARSREDFLGEVDKYFRFDFEIDIPESVGAVLHLLDRRISAGEMEDIRHILPKGIREFAEHV